MNTLYDIQGEYLTLLSYADDIDDPQLFLDTLESIQGELEVKADNYGIVIAEMNAAVKKYEAEIERLTHKKEMLNNNVKAMKDRLKAAIELMEVKDGALQTEHYKFKICKNGGKQGLDINEDLVPDNYKRIIMETDTDKIRKELEEGKELSFAALKPRGTHLRIS